jgi:hypothetical protein
VIVALRKSGKFRQQRREGSFLAFVERTMGRIKCRSNAERGRDGDLARDFDRAIELLSGRGHVLNETESIGLICTPFITRQHVSHRIAPACLANERNRRTASREMASGHFSLREYGIARGNTDVSREEKLVACALALALNCDNKRLLSTRRHRADWINELWSFREATGTQDGCPASGIEDASHKVGSLGIEDADAQGFIVIEQVQQAAQADDA